MTKILISEIQTSVRSVVRHIKCLKSEQVSGFQTFLKCLKSEQKIDCRHMLTKNVSENWTFGKLNCYWMSEIQLDFRHLMYSGSQPHTALGTARAPWALLKCSPISKSAQIAMFKNSIVIQIRMDSKTGFTQNLDFLVSGFQNLLASLGSFLGVFSLFFIY